MTLEHIANLEDSFHGMVSVLNPDGLIVHLCPNYIVSYEPHVRKWLIPFFPGWTRFFLDRDTTSSSAWRSLNFITYFDVKRIAERNGLQVEFEKGVLRDHFVRLASDPLFAQRHSHGLIGFANRVFSSTGLYGALAWIPPFLSSPMIFSMKKKG